MMEVEDMGVENNPVKPASGAMQQYVETGPTLGRDGVEDHYISRK